MSHRYDDTPVLTDITVSFRKDHITAVLGKSGGGKSTLLQVINGMVQPGQGEVKVFGNPIIRADIHTLRLRIGYVVQYVGLFPHMTVLENISLLGKISQQSGAVISERVRQLLDMVQLPQSFLDKYPYQLSGGEQQRVGLCRAMLLKPPVLLMDEPFASLDTVTRQGIYQHLLTIQQQEPRTIILVTHSHEEAVILCDDFIVLSNGTIQNRGTKEELTRVKNIYQE